MMLAGDAGAFIDPFAGDGISIALRSGAMAADCAARLCAGQLSHAEALADYDEQYRRSFLPAFRNAARLRRIVSLPAAITAPAVALARTFSAGELLVRVTRAR
jgi:flavin-dependent dehydrogenase